MIFRLMPIFLLLRLARCLCPSACVCSLDHKGRNVVSCTEGGVVGPFDLFNVSTDTEVLKISAPEDNANQLTMSPVLQKYTKLEEIHITRSNVPQLGMHFFWGLTRLDVLDLAQNNITQPLDHNFRGLFRLKELYLDDNRIYSLPSGTFRHLQELKVLSIQRNRITELMPRIFLEIKKLRVLKLSGNNVKELNPVVFEDVKELKTLECRSCGLSKIDHQIYELLPHLTLLDLGDNELTTLTSSEFRPLATLRHLKLDGNRITAIKSSVFIKQRDLKRLNLARNRITKISANAFHNLHNLTELDLSHNNLENPEKGLLEPVAALDVLSLSGNHLNTAALKELLQGLQVRELRVQDCGLREVPEGLVPEGVQVLDFRNNHISSVVGEAVPSSLQELDLSGNLFKGLDQDLLVRLDGVRVLHLGDNPWSCDLCHIVPLLERANRSTAIKNIRCTQPYSLKGKTLGMIQLAELTWCSVTSSDANYFLLDNARTIGLVAAASSMALLLFFIVVAILGVFLYSRRHAAKYYTHEDKLAIDGDGFFDNHSPLFGDERELSFKFPLESNEKKLSVSTIEEIKKEHAITNGT